jgi:hypothetical protein
MSPTGDTPRADAEILLRFLEGLKRLNRPLNGIVGQGRATGRRATVAV